MLPIDVGKVVVQVWKLNSVCWLSFHLYCNVTQSMLLKNLSDVVRKTWAKIEEEINSNLQNQHAAARWYWQGGGARREAKLLLWAEFSPVPSWHTKYVIEKIIRCSKKHEQKWQRKLNLTFKIHPPLPIDVGKAVVWGRMPNSFCGLRFHLSHHGTQKLSYWKNYLM